MHDKLHHEISKNVSEILDDNDDDQCDSNIIRELFLKMVVTIELDKEGCIVSDCWDTLRGNLSKVAFGKRSLFYLVAVLKIICLCKSYFLTSKTIKKGCMLLFNTTCISNIDLYCVAKCWVHLPKAMW